MKSNQLEVEDNIRIITFLVSSSKGKIDYEAERDLYITMYMHLENERGACMCVHTLAQRALRLARLPHPQTPCCHCSQAECPSQWQRRCMSCEGV